MHEARQDGTELVRGEERLQRGGSGSGRGQFDHDDGKGLLDDDDHGGDYGGQNGDYGDQNGSETASIDKPGLEWEAEQRLGRPDGRGRRQDVDWAH